VWRHRTNGTKILFMDRKLIEKFGSEILCYQIKTARQKKRDIKTGQEKMLLRLHKEQTYIRQHQRNLGYVELNPPVVKGWKRYFVLREDVARSKDAVFYQNILDKINKVEYCNRKDFKKKPRYFRKRKNWELIEQTVKQPEHWEFVKLNFTEKEKLLFEEKYIKRQWQKELVRIYVFKEQWRFVLRIRQNIITKVKLLDVELERRSKEIDDYLERTNQGNTLDRILGHSVRRWQRWSTEPKPGHRFEKKSMLEMTDEYKLNEAL
jgi:hypothetical protein